MESRSVRPGAAALSCRAPGARALLVSALCFTPLIAYAQQEKQSVQELRSEVETLRQLVKQLEARLKTVESEQKAVAQQNAPQGTQPTQPTQAPQPQTPAPRGGMTVVHASIPPDLPNILERLGVPESALPRRDSIADQQAGVSRVNNAPPPTDPELKGFIPIPGTQSMIRIGGFAKVDAIYDFKPAGNPDQFEVPTIPVGRDRNDVTNFELHARQTRFSLEARRPTSVGGLRFYIENDFFGSSDTSYTWRLRQAYGQLDNFYAGFGWSAFGDPDSFPETIDYGGPGAVPVERLASIRYNFDLSHGNSVILSAEKPDTQVTLNKNSSGSGSSGSSGSDSSKYGEPVTRMPDVVLAGKMERDWGHVYLSSVLRQLGYIKDGDLQKTYGGGVAVSGSRTWPHRDLLTYGLLWGKGLSRYLEDGGHDLDAAVEPDGDIKALITKGGWVGFTHYWGGPWRSNIVYGYLRQNGGDLLADDAMRTTQYYALNLIWSPAPTWTMGIEALHGKLDTQNEGGESANRLQGTVKYSFIH